MFVGWNTSKPLLRKKCSNDLNYRGNEMNIEI
jgi:hypothetical protein